jgi:demethylmenaquinone methyltransferase/2-methoxy-6-polyprenyl-1,4-benzoquinol methylase/ArsR family transcriptional regulator
LIIDFAPHAHEFLREQHAHRRLGFSGEEIAGFMAEAGLVDFARRDLGPGAGDKLTVSLWVARDPRIMSDPIKLQEIA